MAAKIVPGLNNEKVQEILDSFTEEEQQEDDLTVRIVMEAHNRGEKWAYKKLEKKVEEGVLVKIWGKHYNGRMGYLYRLPE